MEAKRARKFATNRTRSKHRLQDSYLALIFISDNAPRTSRCVMFVRTFRALYYYMHCIIMIKCAFIYIPRSNECLGLNHD